MKRKKKLKQSRRKTQLPPLDYQPVGFGPIGPGFGGFDGVDGITEYITFLLISIFVTVAVSLWVGFSGFGVFG